MAMPIPKTADERELLSMIISKMMEERRAKNDERMVLVRLSLSLAIIIAAAIIGYCFRGFNSAFTSVVSSINRFNTILTKLSNVRMIHIFVAAIAIPLFNAVIYRVIPSIMEQLRRKLFRS
jgi:hypothetical protein